MNYNKKIAITSRIIILLLLSTPFLFSKNINIELDYASFYASADQNKIEIYYSIPRAQLIWDKQGDIFTTEFSYVSTFFIENQAVYRDTSKLYDTCKNLEHLSPSQSIPHQLTLRFSSGDYHLVVQLLNNNNELLAEKSITIISKTYPANVIGISNIEYYSQIYEMTETGKYTKYNQYQVIPDATGLYSKIKDKIKILFEVYNLSYEKGKKHQYKQNTKIIDLNEDEILNLGEEIYDTPRNSFPIIQEFEINSLFNGIYYLEVTIEDLSNNQTVTERKKFYISGSAQELFTQDIIGNEIEQMEIEELDSVYYIIQRLMNYSEKKVYKKSTLEGKKNFLINFWDIRDTDPSTPDNEYKKEIDYRIHYANENFLSLYKTGASSDMGITLLKYGFPDDVFSNKNVSDKKPHEIWKYYKMEGGVDFVFADVDGLNQYILIHSTKIGETQNLNWETRITE